MLIKKVFDTDTRCRFVLPRVTEISIYLGRLMRISPGCRSENFGHISVFSEDLTPIKRVQKDPIPLFKH